MFKLEQNEAMILLQIIEANQFQGKDILVIAKIMGKLHKELDKMAHSRPSHVPPNSKEGQDKWIEGTVDGKK